MARSTTLRPCPVLSGATAKVFSAATAKRRYVTKLVPALGAAYVTTLLTTLVFFVGSGCAQPPSARVAEQVKRLEADPWADPDEVIVEIDGREITRGDYYHRVLEKFGTRLLLAGVIKEELFLQEATRLGLGVTEEEVEADVEKRIDLEAERAGGRENLEKIYRRDGMSIDDVKEDMAPQVRLEKLIVKVVQASRVIDETALRKRYKETYAETRYRLSHVAYNFAQRETPAEIAAQNKAEAVAKAVRAVQEARSGVDFARIAAAESDDEATRDRGGDMGYVSIADLSDPNDSTLREVVSGLQEGEVSEPVEIKFTRSIHVFKVTEKVKHRSFEEVSAELREDLETRIPGREEVEAELERLAQKADVRILGAPAGGFYNNSLDERPLDDGATFRLPAAQAGRGEAAPIGSGGGAPAKTAQGGR